MLRDRHRIRPAATAPVRHHQNESKSKTKTARTSPRTSAPVPVSAVDDIRRSCTTSGAEPPTLRRFRSPVLPFSVSAFNPLAASDRRPRFKRSFFAYNSIYSSMNHPITVENYLYFTIKLYCLLAFIVK